MRPRATALRPIGSNCLRITVSQRSYASVLPRAGQPKAANQAEGTTGTETDHVIKVCGVMSAEDARLAASGGAHLIGMIMWPKAGRSVSLETAQSIAEESRRYGSEAVGVFVDEDAETIANVCRTVGISYAQLHGDKARASFGELPEHLGVIYVVHADSSGNIQTPLPNTADANTDSVTNKLPDWYLVDSMKGGSGEKFDWHAVRPPAGSKRGWLLAGGLTDENVSAAIKTTRCDGVDVSSGVCDETKLKKDPQKVAAYIRGATNAFVDLRGNFP
jgi:phosphoribosylanthranilate isomerase